MIHTPSQTVTKYLDEARKIAEKRLLPPLNTNYIIEIAKMLQKEDHKKRGVKEKHGKRKNV